MSTLSTLSTPVKFGTKSTVSTAALIRRDGWMCAYCGKFLTLDMMTVDHVIPTLRGGPDTLANTVISCRECNASKGDMTAKEYNHWLSVRRYVFEIAPNEMITYRPVEIATRGGASSVIALPCLWAGVANLEEQAKQTWVKMGALVVRLIRGDQHTDIAILHGTLYDYYIQKQVRELAQAA